MPTRRSIYSRRRRDIRKQRKRKFAIVTVSLVLLTGLAVGVFLLFIYNPLLEKQLRAQFGDAFFSDFSSSSETGTRLCEMERYLLIFSSSARYNFSAAFRCSTSVFQVTSLVTLGFPSLSLPIHDRYRKIMGNSGVLLYCWENAVLTSSYKRGMVLHMEFVK